MAPKETSPSSILVDIEKLDTFILPTDVHAQLIVYCSLGSNVLKSAVGTRPVKTDDTILFDSLLHFPLEKKNPDNTLHFVLRERLTEADLGSCDLSLGLFERLKTPKCVRIKLKSEHDVGIGFLELKIKLSEVSLIKANSAKYCRSPRPTVTAETKVPAYDDSRTQSICFLVYSLLDIPFQISGKFILKLSLGRDSLSIDDLELRKAPSTTAERHFIPIDATFEFPYEGHQYASIELYVYSVTHPPVLVSSSQLNLMELISSHANVRIGSTPMEAVKTVNDIKDFGNLLMRIHKSAQSVRVAGVRL